MPKLIIFRDGRTEREVELGARDLLIGRSSDNDVVLDDPERTVSRHHAEVRVEDSRYVLVDVGSQNGLLLGDERVQRVELRPGRFVSIGGFVVGLELEARSQAATTESESTIPIGLDLPIRPAPQPARVQEQADPLPLRAEAGPGAFRSAGTMRVQSVDLDIAGKAHLVTDTIRDPAAYAAPSAEPRRPAPASSPRRRVPVAAIVGTLAAVVVLAAAAYVLVLRPRPKPVEVAAAPVVVKSSPGEVVYKSLLQAEYALGGGRLDEAQRLVSIALAENGSDPLALDLQTRVRAAVTARQAPASPSAEGAAGAERPADRAAPAPPALPAGSEGRAGGAPAATAARPEPATAAPAAAEAYRPSAGGYPPVTRRTGESTEAWRERSRLLNDWYQKAVELMRTAKYPEAISVLSAIAAEERGYQSVTSLLAEAKYGLATQARLIIAGARKFEEGGDLKQALAELERARQADQSLAEVGELIRVLRERIEREAADAFAKARQHDAAGRSTQAAEQYDRVLKLLAPTDERYQTSAARLKALRTVGR